MVKNPPANNHRPKSRGFDPWVEKLSWKRKWQTTPVFLCVKFHGQRSLVDYSQRGCKELDTTEQLSTQAHSGLLPILCLLISVLSNFENSVHKLNKSLLNTYCIPDTEHTAVTKTD